MEKGKKKNLTTDKHVRPLCSYLWENLATFARIQLYIANGILKGFRGLWTPTILAYVYILEHKTKRPSYMRKFRDTFDK